MYYTQEQKYTGAIKRISAAMLIFLPAFYLLYGGAEIIRQVVTEMLFVGSVTANVLTSLFSALAYIIGFTIPVICFYLFSKEKAPVVPDLSLRLPKKHSSLKLVAIVCVGLSAILTMAYLNAMFFPTSESGNDFVSAGEPYQVILMFLSTAVVPAFVEELLFRGVIYSNLRPYGRSVAILVSALLFGLMHQSLSQLLYATAAGLVLALIYEWTGSFWCCVFVHFFNNYFAVLQEAWYAKYPPEQASLRCVLIEVGIFFVGIMFAAFWLYAVRKEKARGSSDMRSFFSDFSKTKPHTQAIDGNVLIKGFFNPFMIAFLVLTAIEMTTRLIMNI